MRRDTHPLSNRSGGEMQTPNFFHNPPKGRLRGMAHGSIRIQEGEPALSRTYAQYFEFFVLKPRELDTPSFKPLIAFGVDVSRNAAQACQTFAGCAPAIVVAGATSNRRKRKAGRQLLGKLAPAPSRLLRRYRCAVPGRRFCSRLAKGMNHLGRSRH